MSDGDDWAISEATDWKQGRHKRSNDWVRDHAGEVGNRQTRQTLSKIENAYQRAYDRGWLASDDWPASVEDTELYRRIRTHYETETYARRVEDDPDKLRAHVGSQSDEIDVSGWDAIETIRREIVDAHLRLYIYGEPGTGKTRSGCLVARHWLDARRREGESDARILTNIRSLAAEQDPVTHVSNWPALREEIDQTASDMMAREGDPFLFLFDEASSQASGSGKDGYEAKKKLATLTYKIRKYNGSLCIIGHDGKDLHPAVRELAKVLQKETKKKAQLYESINNRNPEQPITEQIVGWPDSKWSPDEHDPAPWAWSVDDDADPADSVDARDYAVYHAVRAREAGVSVSETAEIVGKSDGWVSSRHNGWKRGEEEEDIVNQVAALIE